MLTEVHTGSDTPPCTESFDMTDANRNRTPDEAQRVIADYLASIDDLLPGRITGLYLVGSAALRDYRRGSSDIDFVSVTDSPLLSPELDELERLHRRIARRFREPQMDGLYVTWEDLLLPAEDSSSAYCRDGRLGRAGAFAANPVTWFTLSRHPLPVRGPMRPEVNVNEQELRAWCRANLRGYWVKWVRSSRTHPGRALASLSRPATTWGTLGVARLHMTIRNAEVISKSQAGYYALERFAPRYHPAIRDALASRAGLAGQRIRNPLKRRADTLSFMEHVIEDALS